MLRLLALLTLISLPVKADLKWVNFSFLFGGSTLVADGTSTYGYGWSAISELYTQENSGYLLSVGSATTEANRIEIDNRFLQAGYFLSPFKGLRVAAGPSFNWIDQEVRTLTSNETDSSTYAGPFVNIRYTLPIEVLVLGAQYNYVTFGEYTQSDIFILIGAAF